MKMMSFMTEQLLQIKFDMTLPKEATLPKTMIKNDNHQHEITKNHHHPNIARKSENYSKCA